jgi:hypothetical protein
MSDSTPQPNGPDSEIAAVTQPGRQRWQVGFRTLFLLIAAIAVWITFFINRRQNEALDARIKMLIPLSHELIVNDPEQIAVVKKEEQWFDENHWEIYLPAGDYRLCLATRAIAEDGLAPVVKSVLIASGRHDVRVEQRRDGDGWHVSVFWDGPELMAVEEPKEWNPGFGSKGGGRYSLSEQFPSDQPAILFRRRFARAPSKGPPIEPVGPADGLLLWVEGTGGRKPGP